MKILLVSPGAPTTFWSFKHALKFIAKKAAQPPLGLITVASLLPVAWEKRLVDVNVQLLKDKDIRWADYVFIGGMEIQRESFTEIVKRCKNLGKPVIGGGPMCTVTPEDFTEVDHLVLGESEITLPLFLRDLKAGKPKRIYTSDEYPDITRTPVPQFKLLNINRYATMDIQYSRGCPFNCDFCSVTALFGHKPRVKSTHQFLIELEAIYETGWRGSVFIVDDNFIGNKKILKTELLPELEEWMKARNNPFTFSTEVSINLADDQELAELMNKAGFRMVFIGIETPDEACLMECGKKQNSNRNLVDSVKILQRNGLEVSGGFIVGFDHDQHSIFDRQIGFIQSSGIVNAMVGLLNAPVGTKLFERMNKENRIIQNMTGSNTDGSLNFEPKMDKNRLIQGYRKILTTIYSPKSYYQRIRTFLAEYKLSPKAGNIQVFQNSIAFFRAVFRLGIIGRERKEFWSLLIDVMKQFPKKLPQAVRLSIYGFHFRKISETI